MKVEDLIRRFRVLAKDTARPHLWADADVVDWLNDAQAQACIRARLIREDELPAVCRIDLEVGKHTYQLHPSVYELIDLRVLRATDRPRSIRLVSREWLNAEMPDWRDHRYAAEQAIQDDATIRLVGRVEVGDVLALECYRLPLKLLSADNGQEQPEIHVAHHEHLIQWVLHKAFGVPDSDGFDPTRSEKAERAFTGYFGPLPDADMRRATRTDVAHHNYLYLA